MVEQQPTTGKQKMWIEAGLFPPEVQAGTSQQLFCVTERDCAHIQEELWVFLHCVTA